MKIKRIRIENYGKISGLDKTFTDGINEIFEENGFGKTTLASFIKAMFYGLAPCRANAKDFNDRRRFYPFSGGKFGGSLEFEFDGDEYRIERFFGKKSDTEDELRVFKNMTPTDELSPTLGLKLFGLDEESFEKTLFIDSQISEISSTGTINGLLGDYVSSDDGISFEDALSRLETARKKYKAAKGNNDLISYAQAEINDLKTKIENIEKEGLALDGYYSELARLTEREKELRAKLKEASARKAEEEKWKTYNAYKEKQLQREKELRAYVEKYPKGIPDEREIARAEELVSEAEKLKSKREAAEFSNDKKARLQTYTRTFACGIPSDEAFSKLQKTIDELSSLRAEIENTERSENKNKTESDKFDSVDLYKITLELERASQDLREKEAEAKQRSVIVPEKPNKQKFGVFTALFGALAVLGLILAVAFKDNSTLLYAGFAAIAFGIVGFGVSLVLGILKSKNNEKANSLAVENAKIAAEAEDLAENMRKTLASLGYRSENGVMYDYAQFKAEAAAYIKAKDEAVASRKLIAAKTEQADKISFSVKSFLAKFSIEREESQYRDGYYKLKTAVDDYASLRLEQNESAKKAKNIEDAEASVRRELFATFSRYGIVVDDNEKTLLKSLSADLSDILRLKKECENERREALEYREKNNLQTPPEGDALNFDEISDSFNACQNAIAVKRREISDSETFYETLDENRNKLELAEEKLKAYKEKREIIAYAEKFLKCADDKLQQKYVAPIKNSFVKYAEPLEKALGEKVVMDKNFKLYFESGGEIRDDRHLSSGQRCILSLCFRMSLIENAFGGEKPFIIMDDPFVNLDENHVEKVVEFIKQISKDEQIIYLCCHKSRKLL